jgi:hypothetical protein
MDEMLRIRCGRELIRFGRPVGEAGLNEMYALRYRVYLHPGHIAESASKLDIDDDDTAGRCDYFSAASSRGIAATIRAIRGTPMPAQHDDHFTPPACIAGYDPARLLESGRLVSRPTDHGLQVARHLLLLALSRIASTFRYEHRGGRAGFVAMKTSAYLQRRRVGAPLFPGAIADRLRRPRAHRLPARAHDVRAGRGRAPAADFGC